MQVSVILTTAGLSGHIEPTQGSVQIVVNCLVHSYRPVGVGTEEQRVGVPVRDEDGLWRDCPGSVHLLQHLVQLRHHLLRGHGADHVVVVPQHSAEQDVCSWREISPSRLQVLPDLEATPSMRINVHDVVVLVPEGSYVGGELEEYLDVAHHLEHVDHLGLPGRQRRVEGHKVGLQDSDTDKYTKDQS